MNVFYTSSDGWNDVASPQMSIFVRANGLGKSNSAMNMKKKPTDESQARNGRKLRRKKPQ